MRTTFIRTPLSLILMVLCSLSLHAKGDYLEFVTNKKQWPAQVHYRADVQGGAVFLTKTGFTYNYYSQADLDRIHDLRHERGGPATSVSDEIVHWHAYQVDLAGCNPDAKTVPEQKLPNYYNYFLGNDSTKWAGGMAAYKGIVYKEIYDKVDLKVYSQGLSMKYDFLAAPGADVSRIRMVFNGVKPVLTPSGDLSIKTSVNTILEKAPYAYQTVSGVKKAVACRYSLKGDQVGFTFPDGYDPHIPLVIDPVLVFATYSGGTGQTYGWSATYDTLGNLYAGGECFNTGWPVTVGAFQTTFNSNIDDGINKYSPNGSALIYSTYYGGLLGDFPNTMVVNANDELVMAGATQSNNLPMTAGCYDNTYNGGNADLYVVHFNATGTGLIGATYVGGSGQEGNISTGTGYDANRGEVYTDAAGNIFVAAGTNSTNFPTTPGAVQTALGGTLDAFVIKLNANCSSLLVSTYLGGSNQDAALSVLLNSAGNIVVAGATYSNNFPGVAGGWQSTNQVGDGFIAILNSTGTAVLNATYVGATGNDNIAKIQIDPADHIYAMGVSGSGSFPTTPGVYKVPNGKIFIAELNPTLTTLITATTIGSATTQLTPSAFMRDYCGNVYFTGYGANAGLPLTANAYRSTPGGFWMCVLSQNMTALHYASYFGVSGDHIDGGSSRLDPKGSVYHSICTASTLLPTTPQSWAPMKLSAGYDIASWKFDFETIGVHADFVTGNPTDTFCAPKNITFTNTTTGAQNYVWDFGDGSPTSNAFSPTHLYTNPGTYHVTLKAYRTSGCAGTDSIYHDIVALAGAVLAGATLNTNDTSCGPLTVSFTNTTVNAISWKWIWGDGSPDDTAFSPTHTYSTPGIYTARFIAYNPTSCNHQDTNKFVIYIFPPSPTTMTLALSHVLCFGGTSGAVTVTPSSGTAPYMYAVNTGPFGSSNVLTGLNAATHIIHLRDANGCAKDTSVTITQPAALTVSRTFTDVRCNGANDGTITITGSGGTTPYSYALNTAPFTASGAMTGLAPGTYAVHLKDANGCTKDTTATLTEPTALTLTATVVRPRCTPLVNGSVTLTAAGGTPGYTYARGTLPYQAGATLANIGSGTYVFHVKDNKSCVKDTTITLVDSVAVHATTVLTAVKCINGTDGSINIAPFGGDAPYKYALNTSAYSATNPITGLAAGTYVLHVKDSNGCVLDTAQVITQPTVVVPGVVSITPPLCYQGSDGALTMSASGGTPGYTYAMGSGAYQAATTFAGLTAGTYLIHVKDNNSCIHDTTLNVTQPTKLVYNFIAMTHLLCYNDSSGTVTVRAGGATPPYTYAADSKPYQPSNVLTGLKAGVRPIHLKDANGCIDDTTVFLFEPTKVQLQIPEIITPTCEGFKDGLVRIAATGGTPGYTYSSTNTTYDSTRTYGKLTEGTYTFYAKDSRGCQADSTITLTGYPHIQIGNPLITNASCNGYSDGWVRLNVTGGIAPLTYIMSLPADTNTTGVFDSLKKGVYAIQVVDSMGCRKDTKIAIDQPDTLIAHTIITPNDCVGYDNGGGAEVVVKGGTLPYSYLWSTTPQSTSNQISGLPNGKYVVIVTDAHRCRDTALAIVPYDNCCKPYIADAFTPNGDGRNDRFRVLFKGDIKLEDFSIYNRYGQRVFYTTSTDAGWDGTWNDRPQDMGTYFYRIRLVCGNKGDNIQEYKGDVTLIR